MKNISINNGNTYCTIKEALEVHCNCATNSLCLNCELTSIKTECLVDTRETNLS